MVNEKHTSSETTSDNIDQSKYKEGVKTTPYPLSNFLKFMKVSTPYITFLTSLHYENIPKNSDEALSLSHGKKALEGELRALEESQKWEVVQLSPMKTQIGCKWVYTKKYRTCDSIERYQARLVTQGFTQTYRIDYIDTFVLVTKMNTVRVLVSLLKHFN